MDDYEATSSTRRAERLCAAKSALLQWFKENLQKELALLVSAAIDLYAKTMKDPTLIVFAMEHEPIHSSPEVLGQSPVFSGEEMVYAKEPGDRASRNVYPPSPGGGGDSDDDKSDRSRRFSRGSKMNRSRGRRNCKDRSIR